MSRSAVEVPGRRRRRGGPRRGAVADRDRSVRRRACSSLDAWTLALGAALAVPTTVACAWRWHLVARELGVGVDLGPAVASCYRAQFLNSPCRAGSSVTCTAACATAGTPATPARGCAPSRGNGSPARSCRRSSRSWSCCSLPSPVRSSMPAVLGVLTVVVVAGVLVARHVPSPDRPTSLVGADAACRSGRRAVRSSWSGTPGRAWCSPRRSPWAFYLATYVVAARAVGVTTSAVTLLPVVLLVLPRRGVAAEPRRLGTAGGHGRLGLRRRRARCRAGRRHGGGVRRHGARREPSRCGRPGGGIGSSSPSARPVAPPGAAAPSPREARPMGERPYTILSCGMSLDGYLDAATKERLVLSNEADLERVDAVRARVRRDPGRCRDRAQRQPAPARAQAGAASAAEGARAAARRR